MITQQERELAAQLARRQVQREAVELVNATEPVLRRMSDAIIAVDRQGHPELRDDLIALKELWRKVVFVYLQSMKQTAQADEARELHAIVDAMRRESHRETPELGRVSIGRLRRVMARAVRPVEEVLDAG